MKSTSDGRKAIKVYIKFTQLDWKMDVVEMVSDGTIYMDRFNTPVFMKALNIGDISNLPQPSENLNIANWAEIFNLPSFRDVGRAEYVETEPIFGIIKFVFLRRGERIMKWEYVNGKS